jgi:hypothetical protein
MLSDYSVLGPEEFRRPRVGHFTGPFRVAARGGQLSAERPFLSFAHMGDRVSHITVIDFLAVFAEYAVATALLGEPLAEDGQDQPEWDIVVVLRPPASAFTHAMFHSDTMYSTRLEGIVAGYQMPPQVPPIVAPHARFVVSVVEQGNAFPLDPVTDGLYMRIFRECMDVPVRPRDGFALDGIRLNFDPNWISRPPPRDHSTWAVGMLDVFDIVCWHLDTGMVAARAVAAADAQVAWLAAQNGAPELELDVMITPPVAVGTSGPWLRLDSFHGISSVGLAALARRQGQDAEGAQQPRAAGLPIFARDIRCDPLRYA